MATERKKFFDIDIPVMEKTIRLYGKSMKDFDKRVIKVDLTRNLRGKSMEAMMAVSVDGNKAVAVLKRIRILSSFIRRMMRDAVSYVVDSFQAECLDGVLRVKIFLITRKKVPRSVRKALREAARKSLLEDLGQKTRDEIVLDIVENKIQRPLSLKLKKIYPLSFCEIRDLNVEKIVEGFVRKKKEKKEEVSAEQPRIGEGLDQMGEVKEEGEMKEAAEGLDQMKEVEEVLAKRAQKLKEAQPAETEAKTEAKPVASESEEKPKKRGRKKKTEESKEKKAE